MHLVTIEYVNEVPLELQLSVSSCRANKTGGLGDTLALGFACKETLSLEFNISNPKRKASQYSNQSAPRIVFGQKKRLVHINFLSLFFFGGWGGGVIDAKVREAFANFRRLTSVTVDKC